MAYAEFADVQIRMMRDLDEAEQLLAEELLDDVEEEIRSKIHDFDAKVEDGRISERLVVRVEAQAVRRYINNPDGLRFEQDGDYSYSRGDSATEGTLALTQEEWRLLGVRPAAFTIRPGGAVAWEESRFRSRLSE